MREASGQPHIGQKRSKLYSLYTSNDCQMKVNEITYGINIVLNTTINTLYNIH